MTFHGDSEVTPNPKRSLGAWYVGVFPGPRNNTPRITKTDEPIREILRPSLRILIRRIHATLETGLQMILRSLVAPTGGAGGLRDSIVVHAGGTKAFSRRVAEFARSLKK